MPPQSYTREVESNPKSNGCSFHRQGKGDHEIWHNPVSGKYFTVDNKILSRHTANGVLKEAGLKKAF